MTKICIMGTHQSGSTRLFNLVRLIYQKKRKTVYSRLDIPKNDVNQLSNNYDIILSKIHDFPGSLEYLNDYDIKLLPIRNILDCAISAGSREFYKMKGNKIDQDFYVRHCIRNINLFNKFKPNSNFVFKYEKYSVNEIKKLCSILNVKLETKEIISIMKKLENMLNNDDMVKIDDYTNENFRKTLFSKDHNTSGGKINKFINMPHPELNHLLEVNEISQFLEENSYF